MGYKLKMECVIDEMQMKIENKPLPDNEEQIELYTMIGNKKYKFAKNTTKITRILDRLKDINDCKVLKGWA